MTKPFHKRFPGLFNHVIDERNPAYAPTAPPDIEPARQEPARNWQADFGAAVQRHMARPSMYGGDPFTDSAVDAALMACETDTAPVARWAYRPEPCACGIAGPVIVPVGRAARWWLALRRWT